VHWTFIDSAVDQESKHKVPHPYSAAEENAASLTGIRDDDIYFCSGKIRNASVSGQSKTDNQVAARFICTLT
jgi:hypothetical protein